MISMKSYKQINDEIQVDERLKQQTVMKMQERRQASHVWKKTILIAGAAILLFILLPLQMHLAVDSEATKDKLSALDEYIVKEQVITGVHDEHADAALPPSSNNKKTGNEDTFDKNLIPKGYHVVSQIEGTHHQVYILTKGDKKLTLDIKNQKEALTSSKTYGDYELKITTEDAYWKAIAVKKDLTITITGEQVHKEEFYTFLQNVLNHD